MVVCARRGTRFRVDEVGRWSIFFKIAKHAYTDITFKVMLLLLMMLMLMGAGVRFVFMGVADRKHRRKQHTKCGENA